MAMNMRLALGFGPDNCFVRTGSVNSRIKAVSLLPSWILLGLGSHLAWLCQTPINEVKATREPISSTVPLEIPFPGDTGLQWAGPRLCALSWSRAGCLLTAGKQPVIEPLLL